MSARLLERDTVRRVAAVLAEHGLTDRVVPVAETARTAVEAAAALRVPVGAIVKSLVFAAGDGLLLACVAGDRLVDTDILARVMHLSQPLARVSAERVKAETGFSIGGVAPVGHLRRLPVILDPSLDRFPDIYAAAGHPHCVFRTSLAELARLTHGHMGNDFAVDPLD